MSGGIYRNTVASLTFGFVVLQHFELFAIGTYPVTLGLFVGLALIIMSSSRLNIGRLIVAVVLILVPNSIVQIASPSLRDGSAAFFETYGLFVLGAVVVSQYSKRTVRVEAVDGVLKGAFGALIVIVALSVIQVFTGSRGSVAWFNPWGSNQYLYEYNPHLEFNPIPRAAAFYLEPSYAAFVVGTLSLALIVGRRHSVSAWALGAVGLLAVRSATGLLVFSLVAVVAVLMSRSKWRVPAVVAIVAGAVVAVPYLAGRLDSTFTVGSSAYYRLIGPLSILRDTLNRFPLGHPFGSLRNTVADYGILNGAAAGDSLDNGFYVVVFYFGWLGLIACFALVAWAAKQVIHSMHSSGSTEGLLALWSVGTLIFSGGIMLPEYLIMLWLIFAIRSPNAYLSEKVQHNGKASVNRHDYVPRSGRTRTDPRIARGLDARSRTSR